MPAVSIVIPMFNAEKYIGECLDSILNQTFRDFEVIVVDDCSTDSSRAVVESYVEKFGGRLKLARTLKNLGNPSFPRNKGLSLSRGEYISFFDADDTITPTALEELYSVAKKFDTDVVACERFYQIPNEFWNDSEYRRQLKPFTSRAEKFVDKPTLLTDDLLERLQLCKHGRFSWNVWQKLIRRDLIFENEFNFSDTIIDDMVFTVCLLCTAEKFLLVPNVINYYRVREDSISGIKLLPEKFFRKYVKAFAAAFRYMDKFLNDRDAFRDDAYLKYLVFEIFWSELFGVYFFQVYEQGETHQLDKILMEELSGDDNLALAAFTFNMSSFYYLKFFCAQQRVDDLEKKLRSDLIGISQDV